MMPGASKWGSEFLVNTTTLNLQSSPTVTALPNGQFFVAWTDGSQTGGDTSFAAIRGQLFNASGSKAGGEFLINTTTSGSQQSPISTVLHDGRFVVVWWDDSKTGGDTSGYALRGQAFNSDGSRSGDEFLINTTAIDNQTQPTITALSDGRFVVAWTDYSKSSDDPDAFAVRGQVFNANGGKAGGEFLVNTTKADSQLEPAITGLADGRFVITWTDYSRTGGDTSDAAIKGQLFNADGGKAGGEFLVNTTTLNVQLDPSITVLSDGHFVVTWMDGSKTGGDTSGYALRGQVFNVDGSKFGDQFLVNTITTNTSTPQPLRHCSTDALQWFGRIRAAFLVMACPMLYEGRFSMAMAVNPVLSY
jgi:hypothetical protein